MTQREYKRKSALLTNVLRYEYWDKYARNLISDLLKGYDGLMRNNRRRRIKS